MDKQLSPQQARLHEDRLVLQRIFNTPDGKRLCELLHGIVDRSTYHWTGLQPHHHSAYQEGQRANARMLLELGGAILPEGDSVYDPRKFIPQFVPEHLSRPAGRSAGRTASDPGSSPLDPGSSPLDPVR